jgi:hypothetical protein
VSFKSGIDSSPRPPPPPLLRGSRCFAAVACPSVLKTKYYGRERVISRHIPQNIMGGKVQWGHLPQESTLTLTYTVTATSFFISHSKDCGYTCCPHSSLSFHLKVKNISSTCRHWRRVLLDSQMSNVTPLPRGLPPLPPVWNSSRHPHVPPQTYLAPPPMPCKSYSP